MASGGDAVIVFLGPSLDHVTAEAILPDATFLPPVCQGQLLSAVDRHRPEVVAIIDGEFGQSLAVWHKEILHTLGRGVRVLGASSMGALRAAECDVYGMEGVGRVYEWYRDGLTDDDEVALLHGPADTGWRNLSWPMVNVRATVEHLRERSHVDDAGAEAVLDAAKALYFGSRTEAALARELEARGRADGQLLAHLVTRHFVDQKRLDAKELLALVAAGLGEAPSAAREPRERLGWLGQAMRSCDTHVERHTGSILRHRIIDDAALHEADFEELQERAIHRALVADYALELGHDPSAEEVAAERTRFLNRRRLTEETLPAWLEENDLDASAFDELLVAEARSHRLRRWYLGTLGYERNRAVVADQLRLEGRYAEVADRAARRAALADAASIGAVTDAEVAQRVLDEHVVAAGWRPTTPLDEWLVEHGFCSPQELLLALSDADAGRREGARRRRRSEDALASILGRNDD